MAEDLGEKTESPSARKLSEARERGNIAKSPELSGAVDLLAAVLLVAYFGEGLIGGLGNMLRASLGGSAPGSSLIAPPGPTPVAAAVEIEHLAGWSFAAGARAAAPIAASVIAVILAIQLAQVRWLFTLEPLMPKLEKISPLAGISRLLGRRNLVKTALNAIKMAVIGTVVVAIASRRAAELAALPMLDVIPAFRRVGGIIFEVAAWMLLIMLVLGIADYAYQRWQHTQDLKMTKQEVRDERKSGEGDPEVKGRRLRMARQMIMDQMRSNVTKADVIVTNPTHFSVALKYDSATMAAPRVVAKGADYMAFRIREVAVANGVPIVEKPALARALFAQVEVGHEVRPELYEAVAEVLAYVYRLNRAHAGAEASEPRTAPLDFPEPALA